MKIIIQGITVETTTICDIELITNTREAKIIITRVDLAPIVISRSIPYETRSGEFQGYWAPYKKLYNEIKAQWESDKIEIPVFKL